MDLKKQMLAAAATLAVMALVVAGGRTERSSAQPVLDTEEQAFLTLINNYRAQNGAGPLLVDPSLQAAAEWMSNDMGVHNYFGHTDSLGRTAFTRMCDFGYCYSGRGENIAGGFSSAQSVFNAWKASPGHDNNMRNASFRVTGIGRVVVPGSQYGTYWTNDFGSVVVGGSPPPGPSSTPTPTPTPVRTPTPAPTPTPSPTPACPGDADCDGWSTTAENYFGTRYNQACPATAFAGDEATDSWPPDFNDDRQINFLDVAAFVGKVNPAYGEPGFLKRFDLDRNSRVNVVDVYVLSGYLGRQCN